jgi:hypothetical protein
MAGAEHGIMDSGSATATRRAETAKALTVGRLT